MPEPGETEETVGEQMPGEATGEPTDERAAFRAEQGLPESVDELSDEQRQAYIGQPTSGVEAVNTEEAEVLAMQDTGEDSGEAIA
jgi:hypothetical protein